MLYQIYYLQLIQNFILFTCFNQYNLQLYNIEGYISFQTTYIDKYGAGVVLYIDSKLLQQLIIYHIVTHLLIVSQLRYH